MQVHLLGTVLQVRDAEAGPPEKRRPVKELSIQVDTALIHRVRLDPAKFTGEIPTEGQSVALVCWVAAWVHSGSGEARQSLSTQRHFVALPVLATV